MGRGGKNVLTGTLVIFIALVFSTTGILGFPDGASDGNKVPPACTGCHVSAEGGTVTVAVPADPIAPGGAVDITVTVTLPVLGANSMAGVFLLKGAAGVQESVTADSWTIVSDPNGGALNYIENDGLSAGNAAKFVWSLKAPGTAGEYQVHAMAAYGGSGAASESSDAAAITVAVPEPETKPHPVISEPKLPSSAFTGTVLEIRVRIVDSQDGVKRAAIHCTSPGSDDPRVTDLELMEGTPPDGLWGAKLDVGDEPGALELYLTASDGQVSVRSPSDGAFVISVLAEGMPEISVPSLPATVETKTTLHISVPMADRDGSVQLAVLRYRLPGSPDYTTVQMCLDSGCASDGVWVADIQTGTEPGVLELCLAATDGENDVCSPATGCYSVLVVRPQGPSLEVECCAKIAYGSSPEVRARVTDGAGVLGVQAHFRLNGIQPDRVVDMTLQTGNDQDGVWAAVLPEAQATGDYEFTVVARNARTESQSGAQTIRVLPDIYVSGLWISKEHPIIKDDVFITALIENRGDRDITGLSVMFLDTSFSVGDERFIRVLTGVSVPANGNTTVRALWRPQVEGDRNIAVVINPDRSVDDANPENDRAVATIHVGAESGMGVRFYVPTLGEIWFQLTIIIGAATAVGASLLYGLVAQERRGAPGRGNGAGKKTAGKKA